MELPVFEFGEADSASLVELAISTYVAAGLNTILVHAPYSNGSDANCTCGKAHEISKDGNSSAGKHPIAKKWQKPVSFDELRDQLARLKFRPNVGIVLGEQPSGAYLVAVDIDSDTRFAELVSEFGELSETPRCDSGRGYRLFFELPPGVSKDRVRNVTGLGGKPGVDVKVERGQVVVAPSVHASGRKYEWTRGGTIAVLAMPWALQLMPATIAPPKWSDKYTPTTIRTAAGAVKRYEGCIIKALTDDVPLIAGCPEGMRNQTLFDRGLAIFSLCNRMDVGWDLARAGLVEGGIACGLPRREVIQTVANAEKFVRAKGMERELSDRPTPLPSSSQPNPQPGDYNGDESSEDVAGSVFSVVGDPLGAIQLETDKGAPAKIAENVMRLLSQHPVWSGGPAWDTYSQTPLWPLPLPSPIASINRYHREVVDADLDAIQGWLMRQPDTHRVRGGIDVVHGGVRLSAARRRVDLLAQYIQYLPTWDGVSRIGNWTTTYLGCQETLYTRATGRAWMIACVERALVSGTTVDMIPVLEGEQGVGKNRALETLFEGGPRHAPWLTIIAGHRLDQDETKRLACTRWVLHDDELQGAGDCKRVDALKSWASRPRETYRLQYERLITTSPRRALLIGSINRRTYLHDDTGNRRWYPWTTGRILIDALSRDREQLFAEAFNAIGSGGEMWRDSLTQEVRTISAEEADARRIGDPLVDQIGLLLGGTYKGGISAPAELTTHGIGERLGYSVEKIDKSLEMRIASAMRELGYSARRAAGKRCYYPPNSAQS